MSYNDLEVLEISGGDIGAFQTVDAMLDKIHEWGSHPDVRSKAISIVNAARVPENDRVGEIRAIFDWTRTHVRYVDEHIETVQAPLATIRIGGGDCDDFVILLGSLLASLGHWPQRIKLVAVDRSAPGEFSHVYMQVWTGDSWLSLDAIVKDKPMGWQPQNIYREETMNIGAQALVPTARVPKNWYRGPRTRYHKNIRWQTMLSSPTVNAESQPYMRGPYMPRYMPNAVDDLTARKLAYLRERPMLPPNAKSFQRMSRLGKRWSRVGGYTWKKIGGYQGTPWRSIGAVTTPTTTTTPWWGMPVLQTGLQTLQTALVGPQQTELLRAQAELAAAQTTQTREQARVDWTKYLIPGALVLGGVIVLTKVL